MVEKIDVTAIRGHYMIVENQQVKSGGDDTIESIRLVAEKLNEIIDFINSKEN